MTDVTRVFTEAGTVAHYLDSLMSPNSATSEALCGRTPWPGMWHGTGTQDEEERVLDLLLCARCESVVAFRRNGHVTR